MHPSGPAVTNSDMLNIAIYYIGRGFACIIDEVRSMQSLLLDYAPKVWAKLHLGILYLTERDETRRADQIGKGQPIFHVRVWSALPWYPDF